MVLDGIQCYSIIFNGIRRHWMVFHGCPVIQQQYQNRSLYDASLRCWAVLSVETSLLLWMGLWCQEGTLNKQAIRIKKKKYSEEKPQLHQIIWHAKRPYQTWNATSIDGSLFILREKTAWIGNLAHSLKIKTKSTMVGGQSEVWTLYECWYAFCKPVLSRKWDFGGKALFWYPPIFILGDKNGVWTTIIFNSWADHYLRPLRDGRVLHTFLLEGAFRFIQFYWN